METDKIKIIYFNNEKLISDIIIYKENNIQYRKQYYCTHENENQKLHNVGYSINNYTNDGYWEWYFMNGELMLNEFYG